MMLVIEEIIVYELELTLKKPFKTAHSTTLKRPLGLIKINFTNGMFGVGEVSSFADNSYTEETQKISLAEIKKMADTLIGQKITNPKEFSELLASKSKWSFAKAALEMAIYDGFGKLEEKSLATMIGANKSAVNVGIALGISSSKDEFFNNINQAINKGYKRIKLKINEQTPIDWLDEVTTMYSNTLFSVDANASWTKNDIDKIEKLANAGIYLIEQPFLANDIKLHQIIQQKIPNIKISLDESLNNIYDVKLALNQPKVGALTIKQAKIGGISNAIFSIKLANEKHSLPWIGGMLSSGVGRSVDLALSAIDGANIFPSDSSASEDYFEKDITVENTKVINGQIKVPDKNGLGITLDWQAINKFLINKTIYR